jgi:hypothetical protein
VAQLPEFEPDFRISEWLARSGQWQSDAAGLSVLALGRHGQIADVRFAPKAVIPGKSAF